VGLDPSVKKTILLSTSPNTKLLTPPLLIRLKEADQIPDEKTFNSGAKTVAVLLEGTFTSAFRNRMVTSLLSDHNYQMKNSSKPTRMIVISDGDIIRNDVSGTGRNAEPLPLGQEKYTGQIFGNRDFIINCLNYLVDDNGLMELRSRELKLRLIDRQKIKDEKRFWQVLNIAGPPLLVILAGLLYAFFRKRLYSV
jgi:ABC-2 type transport system permease protein